MSTHCQLKGSIPHIHRRTVLKAGGAVLSVSIAGCLGGTEQSTAPIGLAGSLQCDVCGMVIEKHPGPNGQIFFADQTPTGHAAPARFDSLKQCLFPYLLERKQQGWTPTSIYVTDYSAVEYTIQTQGSKTFISSHVDPASFASASALVYVVGSAVEGAMGPDFIPFSTDSDATAFRDEYGGDILEYDQIDASVIGQ